MNLNCLTLLILVSVIKDYTEYIIKKDQALTTIPRIYGCINIVNNKLVFKIKDGLLDYLVLSS